MCVQEAGVKIATIKKLLEKFKFEVDKKIVRVHEKEIGTYQ